MTTDGEGRYRAIFQRAPISLWEQDFTAVVAAIDVMKSQGVHDFRHHFTEHPEVVGQLAEMIEIIDVNPFSLEVFHASSREELLGSLDRVFVPETYPVFVEQMIALASGATRFSAEAWAGTLTGQRIYTYITLSMLPPDQEITRGLITIVDISRRKKGEDELHSALHRSNRELAQFAQAASHDLQEPLRMVTSYAQLMAQRYGDVLDDRAGKYLGYMVEGARRIRQLILDLLEMSNIDMDGKEFEKTDLGPVVAEVAANMAVELARHGAEITLDELPEVMADRRQVAQLFHCLFDNSLKFRSDESLHIQVSARRDGAMWRLAVADNGRGFDAHAYGERIFEMFRRLHTPDAYTGTGIGLTLAKKIAERHDGRIWAESRPGEGATFFVTLPAMGDEIAGATFDPAASRAPDPTPDALPASGKPVP